MIKVKTKLDKKRIPKHIGIIMDGNRRWAAKKGLTAVQGHEAGVKALVKIVEHCLELGIDTLTIYALSTENWRKRAKKEVEGIFNLLLKLVEEKKEEYKEKGIKLAILGNFQAFPKKVVRAIEEMLSVVKTHERLKVNVALNYGGRDEIIRAVQKIVKEEIPSKKINEKMFNEFLYTNGESDPDLVIRTGGPIPFGRILLRQSSTKLSLSIRREQDVLAVGSLLFIERKNSQPSPSKDSNPKDNLQNLDKPIRYKDNNKANNGIG